jgi:hypothetical protein
MAGFEIVERGGHPDFLDLPWGTPLQLWTTERLVDIARGVSRHVVRFVDYGGAVYAIKETEEAVAQAEYDLLRELADRSLPVVEAVGVVRRRKSDGSPDHPPGAVLAGAIITRHLSFSLPYRYLFQGRFVQDLHVRFIDALAVLLVRLHLEGFFWGDCSLSNTLFRHDAGALSAYLVDAETGTLTNDRLSDGQRDHDLSLATDNVGGELLDLEAAGRLRESLDPAEVGEELRRRYDALWAELNREEVVEIGDRHSLQARTRRLNEMGFDVEEFRLRTTEDGRHVRVVPRVVELGHHRRRLQQLTGLAVDENQARRLLNDIDEHRAVMVAARSGGIVPDALAAYDWLTNVYQPTLDAIPEDMRERIAEAEAFHQILEHRWYLSEEQHHDVGLRAAAQHYIDEVLRFTPQQRTLLPIDADETLDLASIVPGEAT